MLFMKKKKLKIKFEVFLLCFYSAIGHQAFVSLTSQKEATIHLLFLISSSLKYIHKGIPEKAEHY